MLNRLSGEIKDKKFRIMINNQYNVYDNINKYIIYPTPF